MSALQPDQLLEQARQLAEQDATRPRQTSLRRAISTAYYALFHLLVGEASRALTKGANDRLSMLVARAFAHEEMSSACRTFAGGTLPAIVATIYPGLSVPPALRNVAQAFIGLQHARHEADYAAHRRWSRTEAIVEVDRAEKAFAQWKLLTRARSKGSAKVSAERSDADITRLFLTWLALQKKLQGR